MNLKYESVLRCDLCDSNRTRIVDEKAHVAECVDCGLKFVNLRPCQIDISESYDWSYENCSGWGEVRPEAMIRYERRFDFVDRCVRLGNILDVGAGRGDRIYQHKVEKHLNEQWNRAIEYATCDWFFHLSTDQRFTQELRDEIREVIQKKDRYAAYYVPLENYFLGKWIQHCGWSPDYNIMLHKRDKGVCSDKEGGLLMVDGEIGYLKNRLIHYSHTEISKTIDKENMISTREAEHFLQVKAPFKKRSILIKPLRNFRKTYWKQKGYKDGMHGLVFCLIFSFCKFLIYAKYWELIQGQKKNIRVREGIAQLTERENRYTSLAAEKLSRECGMQSEKKIKHEMTIGALMFFCKAYIKKQGFRDGVRGLIHSIFNAYIHAIKWAKYWEWCYVRKD